MLVKVSLKFLRNCKETAKKPQRNRKETAKKPQRNRKETNMMCGSGDALVHANSKYRALKI